MFTRRNTLSLGLGAALTLAFSRMAVASPFDPMAFSTLTADLDGTAVTYRFYKSIPYVTNPVDAAYQSLNISVPVALNGKPIDASRAPILLCNSVGGYMPSSVAEADAIDSAPMPAGMKPPKGAEVPTGGNAMMGGGERVSLAKLGLAAGFVVVEPGARGRSLTDANGTFYGVAPAAIVDLKAAVRYLRANAATLPGNTDHIISTGTSAGGALSSLLGATGDSPDYAAHLADLGAADASDAIFAAGCWCPITDLDHADMAYEWNWGTNPLRDGGAPDATLSQALRDAFAAWQASLGLQGQNGFGPLTADTLGPYLTQTYLIPAATAFLTALPDADRTAYLAAHSGIGWDDTQATFTWDQFLAHVGPRKKSAPAFDALDLSSGENNLFGLGTTEARHFTDFSLHTALNDPAAQIDPDLPATLRLMNPMPYVAEANPGRARHWWLRVGAKDSDTSLSVMANLAAALQGAGDDVNAAMYWDEGHGANTDAAAFIVWVGQITDYQAG